MISLDLGIYCVLRFAFCFLLGCLVGIGWRMGGPVRGREREGRGGEGGEGRRGFETAG